MIAVRAVRSPRHGGPRPETARVAVPLMLLAAPLSVYAFLHHWNTVGLAMVAGPLLFAVRRPHALTIAVVPLGLLGAALGMGAPCARLIAVLALITVLRLAAGRAPVRRAHVLTFLLICLLVLGYAFPAVEPDPTRPRIFDLWGLLTGLVLLAVAVADPPDPRRLIQVVAVSGALASAYVLADGDYAAGRLAGFGQNPNFLGALLALPLVAAVGLAIRTRRPLWLLPAAVCLSALSATHSRGAFLMVAAGLAVLLARGRSWGARVLVAGTALGVAALFPAIVDRAEDAVAGDRTAVELQHDTAARQNVARFAAGVAFEHPLRGIGYGMFPTYAERSPKMHLYIATHDDYLRLAAETGVLSLAVFLALLWPGLRGRGPGDLVVLRAMTVAYAVGLLFANELASLPVSTAFWLSLGRLTAGPPDRSPVSGHDHDPSSPGGQDR